MKHYLFFIMVFFMFSSIQAQYVDLGIEIWKGVFAAGDIDNDGDLDVIVSGDAPGDIENGAILINDGAGNFTVQAGERVIVAGRGGNIHFGDIDADGDLDVIFAGWGLNNSGAGIALNDGSGNFTLADAGKYPVLEAPTITSCGFADFDLNGLIDYYFFGNIPGNCVIYFQNPDGTFTPKADAIKTTKRFGADVGAPIPYNLNEPEVTIIDFNNDGYPDMWINAADMNSKNEGEETQRFSYLFTNDGFGVFSQYNGADVPFKKGNGASSWGDINGDGLPDMMLHGDGWLNSGENSDSKWRIFENVSGTSIQTRWEQDIARQGSMGNGSLLVDWDNDGKLDVFGGGWNGSRQEIALFTGDNPANFTFTKSELSDTYFQGASEQGLLAADLNGDNKVDLLINGFCGNPLNKRNAGYMFNQSPNAASLPTAPTGLQATVTQDANDTMIEFEWIAPASESGKFGTTYNLSLKNTTTGKYLYNPMAVVGGEKNGLRKVGGRHGNVFYNKSYELYNLPDGIYEWTVQALNGAFLGGAFADVKTFTVGSGANVDYVSDYKPEVLQIGNTLTVNDNSANIKTLRIYSISGVEIVNSSFASSANVDLQNGLYILEVVKEGVSPFRKKLMIK